uniref:Hypothetical secreted peptide n=1 Tax=Glossina morsitans morsitans TaxID=37546 RepID=D3TSM0_GLOMM
MLRFILLFYFIHETHFNKKNLNELMHTSKKLTTPPFYTSATFNFFVFTSSFGDTDVVANPALL